MTVTLQDACEALNHRTTEFDQGEGLSGAVMGLEAVQALGEEFGIPGDQMEIALQAVTKACLLGLLAGEIDMAQAVTGSWTSGLLTGLLLREMQQAEA